MEASYASAGSVSNWFDEEGFQSDRYSIRDTFGALMAKSETAALVGPVMQQMVASRGDVAKSANTNPALQKMMAGMSFESLLKKRATPFPRSRSINSTRRCRESRRSKAIILLTEYRSIRSS